MDQKPQPTMRRKRGIRRLFGLCKTGFFVIFVTLGIIITTIMSAVRRPFRGKRNTIVTACILTFLVGGCIAGWRWYGMMNDNALSETVTTTLDFPSEASVDADVYTVPANMPKMISLESTGAEGIIQPVERDQYKKIASPNNVHVAGWYTGSVRPGEVGLSIIDAHVQGRYSKGLFYDLAKLKAGDAFSVTFGDGRTVNFRAISIQPVSIRDADAAVIMKDPKISRQLNLIAVTNGVDKGQPASNQRTIVTAAAQ